MAVRHQRDGIGEECFVMLAGRIMRCLMVRATMEGGYDERMPRLTVEYVVLGETDITPEQHATVAAACAAALPRTGPRAVSLDGTMRVPEGEKG